MTHSCQTPGPRGGFPNPDCTPQTALQWPARPSPDLPNDRKPNMSHCKEAASWEGWNLPGWHLQGRSLGCHSGQQGTVTTQAPSPTFLLHDLPEEFSQKLLALISCGRLGTSLHSVCEVKKPLEHSMQYPPCSQDTKRVLIISFYHNLLKQEAGYASTLDVSSLS